MLRYSVVIIHVLLISSCYGYGGNKGSHDEWRNTTVAIRSQIPSKKNEFPPPKFELIGERYFYIERSVEQNWTTAATTCRQMGGYLASIRSEEELRAISMKVNDYTCYYLGMNDHEVRGNFVSLASGRPAALMWTQNEPDYIPGGESCVAIYNDSEKGMMMVPCSNESNFICQADVET
ncbi:accessory gland protein Acp29AB-like [Drosophila simulans]|uniref:C-type lectin domain-containing protein n=1 Tax=Drosophila simulans TaxID=7240 RepID=A0A0J9QV52_DROSI|nr:accessory gland protein Acp29AB-like [Drosophila simulans]KMY87689.1 uncharacterized protein Dsimw501_GD22824 [Drosophila simulans]